MKPISLAIFMTVFISVIIPPIIQACLELSLAIITKPISKVITSLAILTTVALVGSLYHIGYRFDFYFPVKLRRPGEAIPSTPLNFDKCQRLQETIQSIKAHIIASASTRNIYVLICHIFNRQLVGTSNAIDEPSDYTVSETITSSWPTFIPLVPRFMSNRLRVVWAYVEPSSPLEVQLNPDLVLALESATVNSDSFIILHTILSITILHEVSHTITKLLFNCNVSPPGCGPERAGSIDGESGDLLEELLIGGNTSALWKDGKAGEMDKIEGLVLEYRGCSRKLTINHCRAFLTSIKSHAIRGFPFAQLMVYTEQPDVTRFRIVESSSDQVKTPSKLSERPADRGPSQGLGFTNVKFE